MGNDKGDSYLVSQIFVTLDPQVGELCSWKTSSTHGVCNDRRPGRKKKGRQVRWNKANIHLLVSVTPDVTCFC